MADTPPPPSFIAYHAYTDGMMFRVVCLEYIGVVRTSLARRERMLLLWPRGVATVRSCAHMHVNVASIREHWDRADEKQKQMYRLRKAHLTFQILSVFLDRFLQRYFDEKIMDLDIFEKLPSWRGGGGFCVRKSSPDRPLVELLKVESVSMKCLCNARETCAKFLLSSLNFFSALS